MSRSYKHTARCGDRKTVGKKIANKLFRKKANRFAHEDVELFNNSEYKKHFPQWEICDYESKFYTFEEWWDAANRRYEYAKARGFTEIKEPDKKEEYRRWYRIYKGK